MNRQGAKGIEWTDYTWNPVTGCKRGCPYCYARKLAETRLRGQGGYPADEPFRPTPHWDRLKEVTPRQDPANIFVDSMGDLFGPWVPDEWIEAVLEVVKKCPQHTFQFLTQNPERYYEWKWLPWPKNCWLGATATDWQQASKRSKAVCDACPEVAFISCEPLLSQIPQGCLDDRLDWLIIGEQTGPGPKPEVGEVVGWAVNLVWSCDDLGIPVFVKRPLRERLPVGCQRMEWPR